jgi:hypothetical protein
VVDGPVERFGALADLACGDHVRRLLSMQHTLLEARFRTLEGEPRSLEPTVEEARELYLAGFTLYLWNIESEVFAPWTHALDAELGLPSGTVVTNAFVSRRSAGTAAHFDSQDLFVVQLVGEKRWRIAPNEDVRYPTRNHIAGMPLHPDLELQAPRGMARKLPDGARTIDLHPGSVMFVPRGTWHEVETLSEQSFHLVFQARVPTWSDLLSFVLANDAKLDAEEWRAPVVSGCRLGALRPGLAGELAMRLDRLARDLRGRELDIAEARVADLPLTFARG